MMPGFKLIGVKYAANYEGHELLCSPTASTWRISILFFGLPSPTWSAVSWVGSSTEREGTRLLHLIASRIPPESAMCRRNCYLRLGKINIAFNTLE
jgi:hypothetical protein